MSGWTIARPVASNGYWHINSPGADHGDIATVMSAVSYEVRTRLGAVPITFNTAQGAFNWRSKQPHAATLSVYAVETIRRERLLTAEPEITVARSTRKAS